jgi:MFS family permease
VAYRVLQGIGGALLITNSTAIVADAFRHGRVGLGLGVNQVAGAAGFLLGPVVGGLLTAISWRWVFLINVPIGILGTIWGIWRLREPVRLPAHQRFDWFGSLTFVVGLGSLLLALSLITFPMLPIPVVNAMFVVAVVALVAFVMAEVRAAQPMLDLRLFGDRLFGFAALAGGLNGLARGAVLFVLIFGLPVRSLWFAGAGHVWAARLGGGATGAEHGGDQHTILAAGGLHGLDGRRLGALHVAERQRIDEHRAAATARHRLRHQHDGWQHRSDAEHRDCLSAGAESDSGGRDVPSVPVWGWHE